MAAQSALLEGPFNDGESFGYTSISSVGNGVPGGMQITLRGENTAGDLLISTILWTYDLTNCDAEPIMREDTIVIIEVVDYASAKPASCPAVVPKQPSTEPSSSSNPSSGPSSSFQPSLTPSQSTQPSSQPSLSPSPSASPSTSSESSSVPSASKSGKVSKNLWV